MANIVVISSVCCMPVTDSYLMLTFPQFFYLESDLKYRLSRNWGTGVRLDPVPILTLFINIFYATFFYLKGLFLLMKVHVMSQIWKKSLRAEIRLDLFGPFKIWIVVLRNQALLFVSCDPKLCYYLLVVLPNYVIIC